jgi:hypothetical protein
MKYGILGIISKISTSKSNLTRFLRFNLLSEIKYAVNAMKGKKKNMNKSELPTVK